MEPDKATRIFIALVELVDITEGLAGSWRDETEYSKFLVDRAAEARTSKLKVSTTSDGPVVKDATPYWQRLEKLYKSAGYKELKIWLEGKK